MRLPTTPLDEMIPEELDELEAAEELDPPAEELEPPVPELPTESPV
jgi:hypothetical protein